MRLRVAQNGLSHWLLGQEMAAAGSSSSGRRWHAPSHQHLQSHGPAVGDSLMETRAAAIECASLALSTAVAVSCSEKGRKREGALSQAYYCPLAAPRLATPKADPSIAIPIRIDHVAACYCVAGSGQDERHRSDTVAVQRAWLQSGSGIPLRHLTASPARLELGLMPSDPSLVRSIHTKQEVASATQPRDSASARNSKASKRQIRKLFLLFQSVEAIVLRHGLPGPD